MKQKEKGLILLPTEFECVLNTNENCEIKFEPDLSPVPDFATKYMNIKDEKCVDCKFHYDFNDYGLKVNNYLGCKHYGVFKIILDKDEKACEYFKRKKENENG